MMHYHNITHDDMLNGTGLRVVLWVAGCSHQCKNCHNPITWNPDGGIPYTEWDDAELFEWLSKPWTEGITFSGGDPLFPSNREEIGKIARKVRKLYPNKNIWLYTGYSLKEDKDGFVFVDKNNDSFSLDWLDCIDVLVDGPFLCNQREEDIQEKRKVLWRGSSNQRVINIPASLQEGKVVEYEEYGKY